jgi:hypothetical protein
MERETQHFGRECSMDLILFSKDTMIILLKSIYQLVFHDADTMCCVAYGLNF